LDHYIFPSIRMLLVFLFVVIHIASASVQLQYRELLPSAFFYPAGRVYLSRKKIPNLPVGVLDPDSPAQATRDLIESIPVEERLERIDHFLEKVYASPKARLDPYTNLLYKSAYIDPGVLRLLLRFASRTLRSHEWRIQTAAEIVHHVQTMFPDGTFDYMTPEYIIDWYAVIKKRGFRVRGILSLHRRLLEEIDEAMIFGDDPDLSLDLIVGSRRHILKLRRDRLLRTGYEIA